MTEQVLARRRAEDSAVEFKVLADSMPQIVWMATPDGSLDYFNEVWFDYSGTNYDENVGAGWANAVHPDDLPVAAERWNKSLRTGENYETEFRLRSKDGNYFWHVARAQAVKDDSGAVTKWYGTNTNIHASKLLAHDLLQAKNQIESEQKKFQTIFADSSTSMAVLKGDDFIYEVANKSYLSLFNNRDLVGQPLLKALPELKGQVFPRLMEQVYKTGIAYGDHEAQAFLQRTVDGPLEERYFDQTYTRMLDQDGNPYGIFIHAIEVTERVFARRELEETAERLRIAIETANMGTWELDPRSNVVKWSDRTIELFGVDKTQNIPLEAATNRIHHEDRERVMKAIAAALDVTGTGEYAIEYRTVLGNDDVRWLSLLGKTFFGDSAQGRVATRFVGTVLDMTDRKKFEQALQTAKEYAETANSAKSSFLANMSHEIRTPLGAIMGFVSLLKDSDVNEQMRASYVSIIERNSVQLLRIIDDILDLSKVEAGLMLIERIDFSLIELLSDFASLMGFRAREKGILFELKAETELPSVINSDPTRIRQVLMNIVGNAIKFTDRGSVILKVSFVGSQLIFEVEDTGRGIATEQVDHLFQPFSQGDISTTRKYGGTGLGLVLTRKLSEALGGSFILKSSKPDYGSIFVAAIAIELSMNTKMVRALGFESQSIRDAGVQGLLRNKKILLVEDSPDNQTLFSIYLSRASAMVDIASDGDRGVEMATSGSYDLILMDVQMPVMDGITAVRILRAKGIELPIIALTAHAMKEERVRCLEAGYTDFLSKPTQRADLIDLILQYV